MHVPLSPSSGRVGTGLVPDRGLGLWLSLLRLRGTEGILSPSFSLLLVVSS